MRRAIPLFCALSLLAGAASVAVAQGPAGEENAISTLNAAPMPDVTKLLADEAKKKVAATGIYADFELEFTSTPKTRSDRPGAVLEQDPPAGDEVESGVGDFEPILLTVYSPKPEPGGPLPCKPDSPFFKTFQKFDFDVGGGLLKNLRLPKLSFDIRPISLPGVGLRPPSIPVIDTLRPIPGKGCGVVVNPPVNPSSQSLFFTLQPRSRRLTYDENWQLTAGQANFFTIAVTDRAGHVLNGVKVQLDLSPLGGPDVVGTTRAVGKTSVKVTPKRAGSFNMMATVQGGNGQTLSGVAKIAVRDRGRDRSLRTFLGDTFTRRLPRGTAGAPVVAPPDFRYEFTKKFTTPPTPTPGPAFQPTCKVYTLVFDPRLTKCPLDWLKKLGVYVTDPLRPVSNLLGTIKVTPGTGISITPNDNNVIGRLGNVINGIIDPIRNTVSNVFDAGRNIFAGIGPVAQSVANSLILPAVQGAAKSAGEFVSRLGTFLAPPNILPPFAHVIPGLPLPGIGGFTPPKPPGPVPPVFSPPPTVVQNITKAACNVGGSLLSGFMPSFFNPFKNC